MRRHTAATSPRRANITRPRKMARPGQIRSGPVRTLQAAAASGRDIGPILGRQPAGKVLADQPIYSLAE